MRFKTIAILAAFCIALAMPSLRAQTFTIGASSCPSPYYASAIDCRSIPVTSSGITSTVWAFIDYPPYTSEDFLSGAIGDFQTNSVAVVSSTTLTWQSLGHTLTATVPTELTATLLGVEGTTATGTLDLKLSYVIGKTGKYTYGPMASTTGGSITLNQPGVVSDSPIAPTPVCLPGPGCPPHDLRD